MMSYQFSSRILTAAIIKLTELDVRKTIFQLQELGFCIIDPITVAKAKVQWNKIYLHNKKKKAGQTIEIEDLISSHQKRHWILYEFVKNRQIFRHRNSFVFCQIDDFSTSDKIRQKICVKISRNFWNSTLETFSFRRASHRNIWPARENIFICVFLDQSTSSRLMFSCPRRFVSPSLCRALLMFSWVTRSFSVSSWISARTRCRAVFIRVRVSAFFILSWKTKQIFSSFRKEKQIFLVEHSFSTFWCSSVGAERHLAQLRSRANKSDGSWKIFDKKNIFVFRQIFFSFFREKPVHRNFHWANSCRRKWRRARLKTVSDDDKKWPERRETFFHVESRKRNAFSRATGFSLGSAKKIVIWVSNSPQPLSSTSNGACVTTFSTWRKQTKRMKIVETFLRWEKPRRWFG